MTKTGKEWHSLEKRIPKPNPKPPQTLRSRSSSAAAVNGEMTGPGEDQDTKCAICDDDGENANVHYDMHRHHASSGGWGRFYMNMAQSLSHSKSPPSLPPIRPGVAALGASENAGGLRWSWPGPIAHIHCLRLAIFFSHAVPSRDSYNPSINLGNLEEVRKQSSSAMCT
ncbi:hypothetical protein BDW72DRAFT_195751 [Aspergillus terricola var. indicus]